MYQRYQDHLLKWEKYDPEGRFWLARSELAQGHWEAFPSLSLVVVEGFSDFTSTQQEMLIMLAARADKMLITLPGESTSPFNQKNPDSTPATPDSDNRIDLFFRADESCQHLLELARKKNIETKLSLFLVDEDQSENSGNPGNTENRRQNSAQRPSGIQVLSKSLFANPRRIEPAETGSGITCLAALGPRAEVRETGRLVKQLLLNNVRASDILVTTRQLDQYAIPIESIWSDAGIPHLLQQDQPITSLPLARAIAALYRVLREDWSFGSLKKLLRQTPLQLSGITPQEQRSRAVLRMLRALNLRGGRSEILERFQSLVTGLENVAEDSADEAEESSLLKHPPSVQLAWDTLQILDQSFKSLKRNATFSDHTQQLLATVHELFFASTADRTAKNNSTSVEPAPKSRFGSLDEQWDLLAGLLKEGATFQDLLMSETSPQIRWQDYADWLEEQFRFQSLPPRKAEAGEVLILDSSDARHLDVPYLFVLGLHEGSFPGRGDNQPFYSEAERQHWNQLGIRLNNRNWHHREEMQFFYRLATRAQQQLTLSYSYVTSKGGPQYPCSFYQSLRSLFQESALPENFIGSLSPLPEQDQLLTRADCRLRATADMADSKTGLLNWWGEQANWKRSFWSLMSAVRMNQHRFEERGFTTYEGMLLKASNLQALQSHYNPDYTFSASRLESYANCPFRYFLESILKVESLPIPKLSTDHLRRGNLIHDLLFELHSDQWQHLLTKHQNDSDQSLSEKYIEILKAKFEKKYRRSDLQLALDEIEVRLLEEWAGLYETQTSQYLEKTEEGWAKAPVPRYRELSFGKRQEQNVTEPDSGLSTEVPELPAVTFGTGKNRVKVEGRIDRIDVGQVEGQEVFNIIDYKTGEPPSVGDQHVMRGTQLQLALYVVAVIRLNLLGEGAVPWLAGYWGIREQGFLPQFKSGSRKGIEPLTEKFLETWEKVLDLLIPHMADCIRGGEFPVHNNDLHCAGRCPYRTVCRVNQVRGLAEPLQKLWSLELPEETDPAATSA